MTKKVSEDVLARDREIVGFAARTKVTDVETLRVRFAMSQATAYRRLPALCDAGYLNHHQAERRGSYFTATYLGIAWAELDLAPVKFSLATLTHDLALARVVGLLEAAGYESRSERDMHLYERWEDDGRYITRMIDRGRSVNHYADVSLENPKTGTYIAIEVELTRKSRARRRAIIYGYAGRMDAGGLGGVLYLTGERCNPSQLNVIAKDAGVDNAFVTSNWDRSLPVDALRRLSRLEKQRAR